MADNNQQYDSFGNIIVSLASNNLPPPDGLISNPIGNPTSPNSILSGSTIGEISVTDGKIQSSNFVSGSTGWQILSNGNATFKNVTTASKLIWEKDGVNVNVDWSLGNVHSVILGGNRTVVWSNQKDGQVMTFLVIQDSAGTRLLTWPSTTQWPGGTAPTLTTTPNKADLLVLIRDETNNKEYGYLTSKNFTCFLEGTLISTPSGLIEIEKLRIGDVVTSLGKDIKVINTINRGALSYFEVTTESTKVMVTGEHPFMLSNGDFRIVKNLKHGDVLKTIDGTSEVVSVTEVNSFAPVYNLTVEEPNVYIANGFYVHNKNASP